MKRLLVLVVGAVLLTTTVPVIAHADVQDHRRVIACHDILKPDRRDKDRIARFIRCAGNTWNAPNTVTYWLAVARCESGLYWRSYNPAGPYLGVYQHSGSAWPGRVKKFLNPLELNNTNWYNPEANIIVAMRMAHLDGDWGQWTCP